MLHIKHFISQYSKMVFAKPLVINQPEAPKLIREMRLPTAVLEAIARRSNSRAISAAFRSYLLHDEPLGKQARQSVTPCYPED